ncbi:hypothetical protein Plhal304r1_c059g0147651 [Plasmopara halstedii]
MTARERRSRPSLTHRGQRHYLETPMGAKLSIHIQNNKRKSVKACTISFRRNLMSMSNLLSPVAPLKYSEEKSSPHYQSVPLITFWDGQC